MSKIIAVANQKGGVGKTTTAVNLAASLAHLGQETLLIDLDPQGNSTSGLGIDKSMLDKQIYHVLINEIALEDIIQPTAMDWLEIAPATIDLFGADIELVNMPDRELRLKHALDKFQKVYKYVLIDCPPSLNLLTINAFSAADSLLIPIQAEYYALEGLGQLLKTIELIRQSYNKEIEIEGVLITMFDKRMNLSMQVRAEIEKYFGDKVYGTTIPRTVRLAEAPSHGKPIILYDKNSRGTVAYLDLAKEFLEHHSVVK
ncbi:MAG: AAA family ATPase [Endomicrobiales bacterium]